MSASRSIPLSASQVNFDTAVLIQPEDLQRLLNTAVTYAIQQRATTAATATAASAQTIVSTKDLKFAKIKSYSGKPDELEDFINNLELILFIKNDIYNMDAKKITYALSLMTIGNAGLWKKRTFKKTLLKAKLSSIPRLSSKPNFVTLSKISEEQTIL